MFFRLKESLFIEHADPLTSEEINHLKKDKYVLNQSEQGLLIGSTIQIEENVVAPINSSLSAANLRKGLNVS